ncbi:hypothetical protein T08_15070, partial [Trichinella sp. T8]
LIHYQKASKNPHAKIVEENLKIRIVISPNAVCINNTFLLMRHQQSYQKTKKRLMKGLSAQLARQHIEMRYQNQKSMHKVNMHSSATDCPKII